MSGVPSSAGTEAGDVRTTVDSASSAARIDLTDLNTTASERRPIESPQAARRIFDRLEGLRAGLQRNRDEKAADRQTFLDYLTVTGEVTQTLDALSKQLFKELTDALQQRLTVALQEVLEQPIELKVVQDFKAGAVTLAFHVERGGKVEDIMKGQGGSVVNVLSVGLRLLALSAVEESKHRRFLILDEQDCWLKPELVPRLVQMVHEAGKQMGFQVLMISHHNPAMFEKFADRVYRCRPSNDVNGSCVIVEKSEQKPVDADGV